MVTKAAIFVDDEIVVWKSSVVETEGCHANIAIIGQRPTRFRFQTKDFSIKYGFIPGSDHFRNNSFDVPVKIWKEQLIATSGGQVNKKC